MSRTVEFRVEFRCKVCRQPLLDLTIEHDTPEARASAQELLMSLFQEHLRSAPRCLEAYEDDLGLDRPGG